MIKKLHVVPFVWLAAISAWERDPFTNSEVDDEEKLFVRWFYWWYVVHTMYSHWVFQRSAVGKMKITKFGVIKMLDHNQKIESSVRSIIYHIRLLKDIHTHQTIFNFRSWCKRYSTTAANFWLNKTMFVQKGRISSMMVDYIRW
jgi:hypothetical protein